MYLSVNVRTLEKEHWALDENQGTKSYLLDCLPFLVKHMWTWESEYN